MDLDEYMQQCLRASRFPLGDVLVCILVATACIALLLVLAWFLFRPKLPGWRVQRRNNPRVDRGP